MRIAIVGGSPSTEHDHPGDGEVWVHGNQLDRHLDCHVTKIFEIHDDLSRHEPDYPEWLTIQANHKKAKLIVGENFPRVSGVEVFPYQAATAILPLLTSTPAYMMALAIIEGATRIEIYGVDMSIDDFEYFYQRPAMYAWIAYARAKGIEVYIPDKSSLFNDKHIEGQTSRGVAPFGSQDFAEVAQMHDERIREAQSQINQLEAKIHAHTGAKMAYERLAKVGRAVESGIDIKTLKETVRIA